MTAGNALASLDETSALAESVAGDVAFLPRGGERDDPNTRGGEHPRQPIPR